MSRMVEYNKKSGRFDIDTSTFLDACGFKYGLSRKQAVRLGKDLRYAFSEERVHTKTTHVYDGRTA